MRRFTKYFLIILSLVLSSLTLHAQNPVLDSLKKVYSKGGSDTNTVNLLNEIIWEYQNANNIDSAEKYFNLAKALAHKLSFKRGLATSHRYIGENYLSVWELTKALENFEKAELLFIQSNDIAFCAKTLNAKGNALADMGKYPQALTAYYSSIKLFEKINDTLNQIITKSNLATIHRKMKNYTECLNLYNEALNYFIKTGDIYAGHIYNNIGNVYADQKKITESINSYSEALKIFEQKNSKSGMGRAYNNIGTTWVIAGNYEEAYKSFFAAHALKQELNDKKGIANTGNNIATVLLKLGKTREAGEYLKKSFILSKEIGAFELLANAYGVKCAYDSATGNYKAALDDYKNHIVYRDSAMNKEVVRASVQQQMQYDFDKKEADARLEQAKKDAITAEEKRTQTLILWSVTAGLSLVVIFALFIFRALRLKQKANKEILLQKEIIEEKQKEILDSIYYARRIQQALITSEKYFTRNLKRLKAK